MESMEESLMRCVSCLGEIDFMRAEFIQEFGKAQVCRHCSTEQRAYGQMVFNHKTAPTLVMVPANSTEAIRRMDRANRRAR